MKRKDLFEFGNQEEDFDFSGFDFSDQEDADVADLVFFPSHLTISATTFVDLIHNSNIVISGEWQDVSQHITDNWSQLNGTYIIASSGQPLHTFTVARQG